MLDDPSDTVPGWLMVIASSYPAAIRAADLITVNWTAGPTATVSEKDIQDHAVEQIRRADSGVLLDTGTADTAAAFRTAKSTLEQTYTSATVLHFQLEPVNALAFEKDGRNAGSAPNSVGGAHRQAEVVRRAAARAGWGAPVPPDTGLGLGTSFGQERDMPTWLACAARVRVDRNTGVVTVEKLAIVVDAGTIVDPESTRAQVEGGALWGLSMALYEGTAFENGQVKDTSLDTYTPLRIGDVPDMDISFVDSTEVPVGLGEPATTVVGPAIGNAIFAAVGARLRHIPITPEAVRLGISSNT